MTNNRVPGKIKLTAAVSQSAAGGLVSKIKGSIAASSNKQLNPDTHRKVVPHGAWYVFKLIFPLIFPKKQTFVERVWLFRRLALRRHVGFNCGLQK